MLAMIADDLLGDADDEVEKVDIDAADEDEMLVQSSFL
jgi:hypothetical protein